METCVTSMSNMFGACGAVSDLQLKESEERMLRARAGAENARQRCAVSQSASVESLERAAESHYRIAESYEVMAKRIPEGEEWVDHAAHHREFAQQDRQMAERMRRMTETAGEQ